MKNLKNILLVIMCLFAFACNSEKSGKVVFESADKKIKVYESEVNYELQKNLDMSGLKKEDLQESQLNQMKLEIVQNLALTRAIALEGKNQNLHKSSKYTDGLENIKESLLSSVTISERANSAEVNDNKVLEVYEANKANFTVPEDIVKLQVIMLQAQEKEKAETILKEAVANPNKFTEIVAKNAPEQGTGETGEITVSNLEKDYKEISAAIKDIEAGKVVNKVVVEGNEAYIVKVLEKTPKGVIPFEKVKDTIKKQLLTQERQLKVQSFIQEMTQKYKLDSISNENVKFSGK